MPLRKGLVRMISSHRTTHVKPILPPVPSIFCATRHHVTHHDVIDEPTHKNGHLARRCEQVTRYGVYSNIGLVIIKGSAGIMTNSMGLIADAYHSLTDLISDFITFFTIKFSKQLPTRSFPFGFGKIDTLGTLSVASLLSFGSLYITKESFDKLYNIVYNINDNYNISSSMDMNVLNGSILSMPHFALGCVVLSIFIKEWLYRITIKAGNEYSSNVTIANAWHHRSDAYTSLIALIGVGGTVVGYPILDPLCGIIIGLYLIKIGINFGQISILQLLDHSCNENKLEYYDQIKNIILNINGVNGIDNLIIKQSGQFIHIYSNIFIDSKETMYQVDKIIDNVKHELHHESKLDIQYLALIPMSGPKEKGKLVHDHEHIRDHT